MSVSPFNHKKVIETMLRIVDDDFARSIILDKLNPKASLVFGINEGAGIGVGTVDVAICVDIIAAVGNELL